MRTERFAKKIKEILTDGVFHSVDELVLEANGSPTTIRRHLKQLEQEGYLIRVRGGAILKSSALGKKELFSDIVKKKNKLSNEYLTDYLVSDYLDRAKSVKERIGAASARYVQDGDIIFIGSSSTTYYMIDHITARNITVLTDGYPHLLKLIDRKINTFMLEGFLDENRGLIMYTDEAMDKLKSFHFHKIFLGTVGIDEIGGYTTKSMRDANVKKIQKQTGDQLYILADSTKFSQRYFAFFAGLEEATLITDQQPPFFVEHLFVTDEVK